MATIKDGRKDEHLIKEIVVRNGVRVLRRLKMRSNIGISVNLSPAQAAKLYRAVHRRMVTQINPAMAGYMCRAGSLQKYCCLWVVA